jgi:hypothetical protein
MSPAIALSREEAEKRTIAALVPHQNLVHLQYQ